MSRSVHLSPPCLRCKDNDQAKVVSSYLLSRGTRHILAIDHHTRVWEIHLPGSDREETLRIVRELRRNGILGRKT